MENYDFVQKMREKNRFVTNSNINNPDSKSEFYISENDRLFGDNFATGEYLRRKQENEKKKEKYKFRQNQLFERERKRWERLDYEYLRKENQSMMNKERNLVGRKNNPGMAFNPLNLQYDNSVQGEILKRRDEESKYRSWLRSINIDKHSNTGYNIINGEERTILEERLNKDIVPDIIQKNIEQINEMKNKVIFNSDNFYTRCNPGSPETRGYRYDNSNMNGNYSNYFGNRNNKSTSTPNILNNNGGRYRAPIDLRDEQNLYSNNVGVNRSNILSKGTNNYNNNFNNNNIKEFNNRNKFSFSPLSLRNDPYEMNDINNNKNNILNNNMNNNMDNNFNNNKFNNNNFNNNERNNINNNESISERNRNFTPNVGIIDLNNMDSNNQNTNNNTINNNNFMNNRNNNFNESNVDYDRNNMNITPTINNMKDNEINEGKNDFYYKGSITDVNNMEPGNYEQNNFEEQRQVQNNYHVNPYNPYARPDFF